MIDPFASQNFPPSPQPQAEKGLTHARVIHSTPGFCVTTPPAPARRPVAAASAAFLGSNPLFPPTQTKHNHLQPPPTKPLAPARRWLLSSGKIPPVPWNLLSSAGKKNFTGWH